MASLICEKTTVALKTEAAFPNRLQWLMQT
jgi:hypothetical protein